ncbi:MAG TPA: hypothetical protein VHX65_01675 [Pirellulales bacterium]|nr:hypothetical protein [Pirellulales bacterium]
MDDSLDFLNAPPPPPRETPPVMRTRTGVIFGGIGIAALVAARIAYWFWRANNPAVILETPIAIEAASLHASLARDPKEFAAEFKGRLVEVHGTIAKLDRSTHGNWRVWLLGQDHRTAAVCGLLPIGMDMPAGIGAADEVIVRGRCNAIGKLVAITDVDWVK